MDEARCDEIQNLPANGIAVSGILGVYPLAIQVEHRQLGRMLDQDCGEDGLLHRMISLGRGEASALGHKARSSRRAALRQTERTDIGDHRPPRAAGTCSSFNQLAISRKLHRDARN